MTYLNAIANEREIAKGLTKTNQGGDAYAIDDFKKTERFLILGSEENTYYASNNDVTKQSMDAVKRAIVADGKRVVDMAVDVSVSGRAYKNSPALFVIALCSAADDPATRAYALSKWGDVTRGNGSFIFELVSYAEALRGWGRSLKKATGRLFTDRDEMALARLVTKYQQREGWSMADVLRLGHPKPKNAVQSAIFRYVTKGELDFSATERPLAYLQAVEMLKTEIDPKVVIQAIETLNLPREVIPTNFLNDANVWEALLQAGKGMPMHAMTRNLATMTRVGLVSQGSDAARFIIERLHDENAIRESRLHPMELIKAKLTYGAGRGVRGSNTWEPVRSVVDALESGFYRSFGNVQPIGKSGLIAIDVSGSMTFGEQHMPSTLYKGWSHLFGSPEDGLAGIPYFSPRIAASVMAMVTARVERDCEIVGFTSTISSLNISKHDSLDTVMQKTHHTAFGGTDCAAAIRYAMDRKAKFEWFLILTDSETGGENPSKVMRQYREKIGNPNVSLAACAMVNNEFSIADPTDPRMLDVVGFDTATPSLISAHARGDI